MILEVSTADTLFYKLFLLSLSVLMIVVSVVA